MDPNVKGNTSKELLYSEYTGSSVVEHVLEKLEGKSSKSLCKKIDESFKKNEKSETFERVKKLMSLIEKEQDVLNASTEGLREKSKVSSDTENEGAIEVVMEVDENSPESDINAWFLLKPPKEHESKVPEDESVKNSPAQGILDFSESSDTSDDESQQNFPIISNGFTLNDTDSSNSSDKKELNPSSKMTKAAALHLLIDDSSSFSDDELGQNFPIIANGFMLNNTDSSNCSSDESETDPTDTFKMQNSSNFVNDDSSNSSGVKNGPFATIAKRNMNEINSDSLQLPISFKRDKRIFEIVDNECPEDNRESVRHSSLPSNGKRLSPEKKPMFVVQSSSYHSLDECGHKSLIKDNSTDSSSVKGDFSVSASEEITTSEIVSSKLLSSETAGCLSASEGKKRKLSTMEEDISHICDTENHKRVSLLERRVDI